MPLVKHNYELMHQSDIINEAVNSASNVRIRFNCEFLQSCEFRCAGCYVSRKNNFDDEQLDILINAINVIRENKMTFDEVILGPTDFFAALNTRELMSNQQFADIFKDGDVVLTLLSTLQSSEQQIVDIIEDVNKMLPHPNQEIEVLIVFDLERVIAESTDYLDMLKQRIELLNKFDARVDYALQMNIQDVSKLKGDFTLDKITRLVRDTFDTIVEFNPSFMRSGRTELMGPILEAWNKMLQQQITIDNKDDITFTMSNDYHAGFNELTYNFYKGDLYMCPFIYENVFDKKPEFKIPKTNGNYYTWDDILNHDRAIKVQQFAYAPKTSECNTCPNQMSCISKHVLYYMEQYGIKQCMLAKPVIQICK